MMCRERLESYLRKNRVPFGVHRSLSDHLEPGGIRGEHVPSQLLVSVAVVIVNGTMVMLAFPITREVDMARVRALFPGREVRVAQEGELAKAFPGCEAGALPPFGPMFGLAVYADHALEGDRAIFFHDGTQAATLSVGYGDFKRLVTPTIAEFTHMGRPEHPISSDMAAMGGLQ